MKTCMHQGPPPKEWNCSLPTDHDGPHVARTAVGRFTWPNDARAASPPDALDEMDRLHAAATAGEWEVSDRVDFWSVRAAEGETAFDDGSACDEYRAQCSVPTRDAIVALHNAWPAFSARLRAAEAEVERLRGALLEAASEMDSECEGWGADARAALGEP